MSLAFVLPGLILVASTVILGVVGWELPPRLAVRALTAMASIAAGTVAILIGATAIGFLLGSGLRSELVAACRIVPFDHEIQPVEGIVSLMALAAIAVRVAMVFHRRRVATRGTDGKRLSIVDMAQPMAYAAPGNPGCVVVSTGLLSVLEPRERQVVFAHERAHLRQGHHRYLLLGFLAVAVLPLLRPLVDRLRLATERCADEEAAATLGGDRQLVATAIAKAAVTKTSFDGLVPAFNSGSIVARVNALVGSPPSTWSVGVGLVAIVTGTLATVGAGSIQLHHLWVLVNHICGG